MDEIRFKKAYYIKLGRGGGWEKFSIEESRARIGWKSLTLDEINGKNWDSIREKHQSEYKSKGTATADINALKTIVESTSEDIWVTFHARYLWWCRFGEPGILEDCVSRYRKLAGKWNNHDIKGNPLLINQIPGNISKVQRFQGTICKIRAIDALRRLINNQPSKASQSISEAEKKLEAEVEKGLKLLHWKDFETLVDLIFRNAGWRRVSLVGETLKYVDMELEEPVTGDLYQVQVKSSATTSDFKEYVQNFHHGSFKKLYFVVHSPESELSKYKSKGENVELILPKRLAKMIVKFGLTDWLLKKIR